MPDAYLQAHPPSPDQRIVVDVRGPGEWIVCEPGGGRSLHLYRLARGDWLVSEVGRGNEGRGKDLEHALAALAPGVSPPHWWHAGAGALDGDA